VLKEVIIIQYYKIISIAVNINDPEKLYSAKNSITVPKHLTS